MKRSTFIKEEFESDSNRSIHYLKDNQPAGFFSDKFLFSCGGLVSSVNELANYIKMLLNDGTFNGTRIICKKSLDIMWHRHVECHLTRRAIHDLKKEGYGYGWIIVDNYLDEKIVYHLGGGPATSAGLWLVPKKKIGVGILCNTGGTGQETLYMIPLTIIASLLGRDPIQSLDFFKIKKNFDNLIGIYTTYQNYCPISVIKVGFQLYLHADPNPELDWGLHAPLIPINEDLENLKFYMISGPGCKDPVYFRKSNSGVMELYWSNLRLKKVS